MHVKMLNFLILIIFMLFMTSCSKGSNIGGVSNDGIITNSKLTDREKQLMNGIGADKLFIFDVNIKNVNINWVEVWLDYYEKGELKSKITGVGTQVRPSNENLGFLMLSKQSSSANKKEEKWIVSYNSKASGGTGSTTVTKPKINLTSVSMPSERNQIVIDKVINLAVIEEGDNVTGVSEEIFNNTNSYIEKASKANGIYILRCKFIRK